MHRIELWKGWNVIREIGNGGYGRVYLIEKNTQGLTMRAALKVISSDEHNELTMQKLVDEYKLSCKLKSAHIVSCDDFAVQVYQDGGQEIYIKMELLTPLMHVYREPMDEQQVIRLGMHICQALMVCNQHGIVHGDIKPQNIYVSQSGEYKLGDFGTAAMLEHPMREEVVGTRKYIAPETYHNHKFHRGSDMYSLGMVLYWLLNQRRIPFLPLYPVAVTEQLEEQAIERRVRGEKIPFPFYGSEQLKRIVLKACEYDAYDRYTSPKEMWLDLANLAEDDTFWPTKVSTIHPFAQPRYANIMGNEDTAPLQKISESVKNMERRKLDNDITA